MDFYTTAYVESQVSNQETWLFILLSVVLVSLLIIGILTLRNGFTSRYRDLTVILSLIVAFFLGFEYLEYSRIQNYSEDSSRMLTFLKSFSQNQNVPLEQLQVNSLKIRDDMILKVGNTYYAIDFNPEFTSYTLKRVYTISNVNRIIDTEKE